ncbi:hypothetical protein B0J13DRAFT_541389 [Dactylonectria estremocensis]|uniref:Myb/SANT-like domain-containing protein n=1 Tax=Dactylonectria estremocensis TaxID=1079267 RepID=A0A9P9JGE1_9HYPO|nr:hypothetical protein B0J13DRAFT_541389 [Dactylonectria estremocensis]
MASGLAIDSPTANNTDLVSATNPEATDLPARPSGPPALEPCPSTEAGSDPGPAAQNHVALRLAADSMAARIAGPVSAADPEVTSEAAELSRALATSAGDNLNDMPPPIRTAQSARELVAPPSSAASRKKPKPKKPSTRLFWRSEMTISFLEYLQEAGAEGRLNSTKVVYVKPVLADILVVMKTRWPDEPYTAQKLMTHYKNLRLKHKQFLSIAYKTGRVSASDEQWEAYDRQHGQSSAWLKTVGLPRPGLYSAVFEGNRAGGASAVEASDIAGINRIDLTTAEVEDEMPFDEEDDEDISEALDISLSTASASESSLATPLKRRAPSSSPSAVSARARRARRVHSSQQYEANGDTMTGSISLLAASIFEYTTAMREVGLQQARGFGPDLDIAISDGKERFRLSGARLVRFMYGLSASPATPVLWNHCNNDIIAKKAMLYELLGEEIEAIDNEEEIGP